MRPLRLAPVLGAQCTLPHLNIYCFRRPFATTAWRLTEDEEVYVNTRLLDETELYFLLDEFPPPPSATALLARPLRDHSQQRLHRLDQRSGVSHRNVGMNPCSSLDWRDWLDEVHLSSPNARPLYPCSDGHDKRRRTPTSQYFRLDAPPAFVKIDRKSLSPHFRSAAVFQQGAWELVPNGSSFHLITGDTHHSVSWFGAEVVGKGANFTLSGCGGGQMLLQCLRAKYPQRSSISDRARIILSGAEGNRAGGSALDETCEGTDEGPEGKLSISPLWVALTDIRQLRLTLPLSQRVTCFYRYQCAAHSDRRAKKPKQTFDLIEMEHGACVQAEAADDAVAIKAAVAETVASRREWPTTADQPPSANVLSHDVMRATPTTAPPSIPDCVEKQLHGNAEGRRSCASSPVAMFACHDATDNHLKEHQVTPEPSIGAYSVPAVSATSSVIASPFECPFSTGGVIKEHASGKNNNCVSLVNFSRRSKW